MHPYLASQLAALRAEEYRRSAERYRLTRTERPDRRWHRHPGQVWNHVVGHAISITSFLSGRARPDVCRPDPTGR